MILGLKLSIVEDIKKIHILHRYDRFIYSDYRNTPLFFAKKCRVCGKVKFGKHVTSDGRTAIVWAKKIPSYLETLNEIKLPDGPPEIGTGYDI